MCGHKRNYSFFADYNGHRFHSTDLNFIYNYSSTLGCKFKHVLKSSRSERNSLHMSSGILKNDLDLFESVNGLGVKGTNIF